MRAENEKDSGLLAFKPRNPEDEVGDDDQPTFDQRWHIKKVCTSYTIMTAISQQTKGKERWRSFIAVQLVRSYTEFSRETVVRLALGECILWHSYPFHNPLRSFRNSGCIYTLPLQLWAFLGGWVSLFCIVLCSFLIFFLLLNTKHAL